MNEKKDNLKPAPVMLIAGGPQAKNMDFLLAEALKLSKAPQPAIAYIGTASEDDRSFFNMFKRRFAAAGAGSVVLVPIVKKFERTQAESIFSTSDLIFLSGGEVEMGMEYLKKHDLLPSLARLYKGGKPFFGVSAGSIMLSRHWLRWRDPDDDNTVELMDCLGFAPLLCDVHAEEDGWEEMKRLLAFFAAGTRGYGIPADGALLVGTKGKVTAIGNAPLQFVKKGKAVVLQKEL